MLDRHALFACITVREAIATGVEGILDRALKAEETEGLNSTFIEVPHGYK